MAKPNIKSEQEISFTACENFSSAETVTAVWASFVRTVTKSFEFPTKEASIKRKSVVGGVRDDEQRGRADNVKTRTILTLDYDDLPGLSLDDLELVLSTGLACAWVAYSTFRSTPNAPRIRIFVPLSRAVGRDEYAAIVDRVTADLDIGTPDSCSKVMAQIFFLASHQPGVEPWSSFRDGDYFDVDALGLGAAEIQRDGGLDDAALDLAAVVAAQPLDLLDGEVDTLLDANPAGGMDYDAWLRVGMALSHQYRGDMGGYERWVAWSKKSDKHDLQNMPTKWGSFKGAGSPVTLRSLIKATPGVVAGPSAEIAISGDVALALDDEAAKISCQATWGAFKARVQALSDSALPADRRALLAATVHAVWGKGAGLSISDLKKALKRPKGAIAEGAIAAPEWLSDWIYAEADCLFINRSVSDYGIRREAFRAKHDREPEVRGMETDAATFALTMVQIPTVLRSMYWPGQPGVFETEGKTYVNSYHASGIPPSASLDADGQGVVDLFLAHIEKTIEEPRERDILLDFMSYIYRSPKHRVRWGLLLWGIEGNGKTYFYTIMQHLLGRNATLVNTSMIERPFNDWAVGSRLIGIEEVRISGTNKWKILDQLKPMISNDTIAVEPKGLSRYHAPNFASYMMTTNHLDAVPVSDSDRRYCIIFTRHRSQGQLFDQHGGRRETELYFDKLFSETNRRLDAIGRYLLDRPISEGFAPSGRAPETVGISEMREANVSDDRRLIDEALDDYASDIVNSELLDVTHLNVSAGMNGVDLPTNRALSNVLRDKGMRPIEMRRIKVKGKPHYVWYRPSGAQSSASAESAVRKWHAEINSQGGDCPF